MNITMKGAGLLGMGNPGLKSTQDRLDRMAKRDNKIAFFEQQKENLKTMKTDSLEDISRKLEMLHGYDDQIALAKVEFNNSQVFHMLDEARELGEKIAEAAEKMAPKTAEERREDAIEEATGVDMDGGILGEVMDELEDITEELTEETAEELEEMAEKTGEAATSEIGEGTLLEDATINVVVDGVTPSTGVTGTIGVSVDEKA